MRTIKILSAGPIHCMNMVHGPILTPYTVDDAKVRALLREELNIVEINPDGSETKLTLDMINAKPNNATKKVTKEAAPEEAVAPATKVEEAPKTVVPVKEEKTEEAPAEEKAEEKEPTKPQPVPVKNNSNKK